MHRDTRGAYGMALCFQSAREIDRKAAAALSLPLADHRRSLAMIRSEEHTSELQSLMRTSYAVFCLKKKKSKQQTTSTDITYYKTDINREKRKATTTN